MTKIRKIRERILAAVMVICEQYLLSTSACVLCPGESVPVNKTSLPRLRDVAYDPKEDVTHTLFCGTKVSVSQQCRLSHLAGLFELGLLLILISTNF